MKMSARIGVACIALVSGFGGSAAAQSAQRFSLQASGAVLFATRADPLYDSKTRLGFEGQARYTFGRFSLGAGYQRSTVFAFVNNPLTMALSFGFVEPRYVALAGGGLAFYLAGRIGAGKIVCSISSDCPPQDTKLGFGGGGGLLVRLSSRLSADLGAQFFQAPALSSSTSSLSSGYAMLRAGLGLGL
jgi:opacity protein-like surface antigen